MTSVALRSLALSGSIALVVPIVFLAACGRTSSEGASGGSAGSSASAASSSPPIDTSPPVFARAVSGSRLRAKRVSSGPGATAIVGLRDTELGVDCEPTVLYDGSERCAPTVTLATGDVAPAFLDASCTTPVVVQSGCEAAAPPAYAILQNPDTVCGNREITHVIQLGVRATSYFMEKDGACVDAASLYVSVTPVPNAYAFTEVGPSSLVAVTSTAPSPRGPSLSVDVKSFEDGAQITTTTFTDTVHQHPCDLFVDSADAAITCVPIAASADLDTGYFLDANCSQEVVDVGGAASSPCSPSAWAATQGLTYAHGCPDSETFSLLGGPAPAPGFQRTMGGTCVPATGLTPAMSFATFGNVVPASDIPSANVVALGSAAVPVRASVASDGTPIDFHGFADSLGHPCTELVIGSDSFCAPLQRAQSNYYGPFYGDAACSMPLFDLSPPSTALSGGCADTPLVPSFVFDGVPIGACLDETKVRAVGAVVTTGNGVVVGKCTGGQMLFAGETYYALGDLTDATTALPRLSVTIE